MVVNATYINTDKSESRSVVCAMTIEFDTNVSPDAVTSLHATSLP